MSVKAFLKRRIDGIPFSRRTQGQSVPQIEISFNNGFALCGADIPVHRIAFPGRLGFLIHAQVTDHRRILVDKMREIFSVPGQCIQAVFQRVAAQAVLRRIGFAPACQASLPIDNRPLYTRYCRQSKPEFDFTGSIIMLLVIQDPRVFILYGKIQSQSCILFSAGQNVCSTWRVMKRIVKRPRSRFEIFFHPCFIGIRLPALVNRIYE